MIDPSKKYDLVAEEQQAYPGFLAVDLRKVVCKDIANIRVHSLLSEIDQVRTIVRHSNNTAGI